MTETTPKKLGWAKSTALMLVITAVLFALAEGFSSLVLAGYTLAFAPVPFMEEERSHTEYDELLGWIHLPELYAEDMYGPGVYMRTSAQRFRADREYTYEVPAGRLRVICSGDSFTLGHSVDNDHAWCKLLETLDPRFETINMGQAAYGVDQAFLWYQRDGAPFDHDVQVFAFITSDFDRMKTADFGGYPKPVLRADGDRLQVENVPVPRRAAGIPRRERTSAAIRRLSVVELGEAALRTVGLSLPAPGDAPGRVLSDDEVRAAASLVFEELKRLNDEKGSTLFLTYLPRTGDLESRWADPWRGFVESEADRLDVVFVDLVAEFRTMPLDVGEQLFLRPYQPSHYRNEGNQWVAEQLIERLQADPTVSARLSELP